MIRMQRVRLGLLAVALAATMAACGGGGGEAPVGSDPGTNPGGGTDGGGTDGGGTGTDGGGTPGPITGCQTSVKAGFPQTLAALRWDRELGGDAIGADSGGADGGGGFGVGGSLGKFIGADVVVTKFDGSNERVGTARTDQTGMVTVNTCGYTGPLEVAFQGNDVALYVQERMDSEDPTQRDITRFKSGERLRALVGAVERNIGVSPFTEAAANYLEKSVLINGGPATKSARTVKAIADDIETANRAIADVLADQLPAAYRPESSRGGGRFKLTQLPVLVDTEQGTNAGTLDNDSRGVAGAVNAGFGLMADTFLPRNAELGDDAKSPSAVIAARQFAADLGDGRLDMLTGNVPVVPTGAPAYTYETAWRAKTIGTARTAERAGTQSLAGTSAGGDIEVAHYGLSAFETYSSVTGGGGAANDVLRRTDLGQTVTLDSGGRLKIERRMSGQVGNDRNYIEQLFEHDVSGSLNRTFVEVKVGSMGEVVALSHDRRMLYFFDPAVLYRITGTETVEQGRAALRRAVETLDYRPVQVGGDDLRVISFAPTPAARVYGPDPGAAPPVIVYVTSDGQLRAIFPNATWNDANGLRRPFLERWGGVRVLPIPAPTALQSVVFDKFAPPGHDPAYGPAPANVVQPWTGPRRLFGLTREGKVVVWLEGQQAQGVTLNIPGAVIQVNADSPTGVYALTSDRRVFWVNADQSWQAAVGGAIDNPAATGRQRALNSVVEISFPDDAKICWIGAEQAVDCASGRGYAWAERNASLQFGAEGAGGFAGSAASGQARIPVPVGIGSAAPVNLDAAVGALWRLTAVEHIDFVLAGPNPRAVRLGGLKYLSAEGTSADKATVGAQRNILSDLICDLASGSKSCPLDQQFAYIRGSQLREAMRQSLAVFSGASVGVKDSFFPAGFESEFFSRELGGGRFVLDSRFFLPDGSTDASRPRTAASGSFGVGNGRTRLRMEFLDIPGVRGFSLPDSFRFAGNNAQYFLDGDTLDVGDDDRIALDRVLAGWRSDGAAADALRSSSNYPNGLGNLSHVFYVNLIPGVLVTESFGFRMCWEVRVETPDNGNGRKTCTLHSSDGTLTGLTVIDTRFDGATQSGPRVDFGDAAEDGAFAIEQR